MKSLHILGLALSAIGVAASAAPVFRNPQPVPIAPRSFSWLMSADFNGDGHDDLMVVSPGQALAVLLANGTGPFAAPVETVLPYATSRPALGDVNGDGRIDVVVSHGQGPTKTIAPMLGNGDGTFTQGSPFTVAAGVPGGMALADFTGDGRMDIAVGVKDSLSSATFLELYAGNGGGSFSGRRSLAVQHVPLGRLTAADMNGDGKTDVVTDDGYRGLIFLNDGTGVFTEKPGTEGGYGDRVVADFNRDGKLDVAAAAGGSHDWYVQVDLGSGDGTMGLSARYAVGYEADGMVAADVDEDGNLDLLAAGVAGSTVSVLRGKADGTFHPADLWLSGPGVFQVVMGDFDRDGKTDFVTADYNLELSALSFVRGNGDGTFATYRASHTNPTVPVSWPGEEMRGGIVADMNDDGKPDVVVIQKHPGTHTSDLGVLLNDGTGRLGQVILTPTAQHGPGGGPAVAVGDVNRDGDPDAVVLSGDYEGSMPAALYLGQGNGQFASPVAFAVESFGPPVLGNFNGDANLDLLVIGHVTYLYPGNGGATFGAGIRSDIPALRAVAGDVNGDGKLDFVATGVSPAVGLNDGTGRFTWIPLAIGESDPEVLGDFNGDGKADLLLTTYTGTETRFGNGDGTFQAPVPFTMAPVPNYQSEGPVATADVDGDGNLDVAFGTSVYLGNGDGTFRSRSRYRTISATHVAFADMDGSGSPDLVVGKTAADNVDVLLTRTTPDPTASSSLTLTSSTGATAQYGDTTTFTARASGGSIPLTAVVQFALNGKPAALIAVNRDGIAVFTPFLNVGSYAVTATYTGDENYKTSTASTSLTVSRSKTAVGIKSTPNPSSKGQSIQLTTMLDSRNGPALQPTGTVTVREGSTVLATIPAYRSVFIPALAPGTHVFTLEYSGDTNYEPATGSYAHEVKKGVPSLEGGATPVPFMAGPFTLLASFPYHAVTGTVSFEVDGVLVATVPLVDRKAQVQVTLTAGDHRVVRRYSGDDNWAPTESVSDMLVYAGQWGMVPYLAATGAQGGALTLRWSPILGAATVTVQVKKSHAAAWEVLGTYPGKSSGTTSTMPLNTTWLFRMNATDANGNVSQMSAPDLATAITFTDAIVAKAIAIKAQHVTELRTAIGSVRTFAGLPAFSYTGAVARGARIRAVDVRDMRAALAEARSIIGLPAIPFTDNVLTPGASMIRAAHINELRTGAN